ncbi:MAG: ASKHA domain-containing protein [Sphaerochaetaceae bacterium]
MVQEKPVAVTIMPSNLIVHALAGGNLLKILLSVREGQAKAFPDFSLDSSCDGRGTCGKCLVRIVTGSVNVPTALEIQRLSKEQLAEGYRLACQVEIATDTVCMLKKDTPQASIETRFLSPLTDGSPVAALSVLVSERLVHIDRNTMGGERDFITALTTAQMISCQNVDRLFLLKAAGELDEQLSEAGSLDVHLLLFNNQLEGFGEAAAGKACFGAAVDIGTTTLAGYLVDLATGKVVASDSMLNSQRMAGADVVSRIGYSLEHKEDRMVLSRIIHQQVEQLLGTMVASYGLAADQLVACTVVGNTAMMHLFLGIPCASLVRYPFIPVFTGSVGFPARGFFQRNPQVKAFFQTLPSCSVLLPPGASAYIGSDITAGIISAGMDVSDEWMLLVDIGTNGEIVLGRRDTLFACSTAAGPAFEGASITCGSGGVTGAIDRIWFDIGCGDLGLTTIHNARPCSICGTGIVDIMALLLAYGLVDNSGRFVPRDKLPKTVPQGLVNRRQVRDGKEVFIIHASKAATQGYSGDGVQSAVYITQKDIREIQLAKAAIAVGIQALMDEAGLEYRQVAHVCVAGGFGSSLCPESIAEIGMFPRELSGHITALGNSAGHGAVLSLLYQDYRDRGENVRSCLKIVELAAKESFARDLMRQIGFSRKENAYGKGGEAGSYMESNVCARHYKTKDPYDGSNHR